MADFLKFHRVSPFVQTDFEQTKKTKKRKILNSYNSLLLFYPVPLFVQTDFEKKKEKFFIINSYNSLLLFFIFNFNSFPS